VTPTQTQAFSLIFIILTAALAIARQRKHEEERLWSAFHFHSVLLIFLNLWPISTLCVADMVHAVADMVCGRYRRFPS